MEGELGFLSILIPTISFWFLDAILLTPLAFKLSGLGRLKPYFTDFPNSRNSQLHNTFYFTLTKKMDMIAEVKYNERPSDTLPIKLKVYKIPAICYICVDVLILGHSGYCYLQQSRQQFICKMRYSKRLLIVFNSFINYLRLSYNDSTAKKT